MTPTLYTAFRWTSNHHRARYVINEQWDPNTLAGSIHADQFTDGAIDGQTTVDFNNLGDGVTSYIDIDFGQNAGAADTFSFADGWGDATLTPDGGNTQEILTDGDIASVPPVAIIGVQSNGDGTATITFGSALVSTDGLDTLIANIVFGSQNVTLSSTGTATAIVAGVDGDISAGDSVSYVGFAGGSDPWQFFGASKGVVDAFSGTVASSGGGGGSSANNTAAMIVLGMI